MIELIGDSAGARGQAFDDTLVAFADGNKSNRAAIGARVADTDREAAQLLRLAQALEPLDGGDRLRKEILAQAEVVEPHGFQPVEIDVIQRQPPAMLLDYRKGRTQNLLLGQAQAARQPLDKAGFACAKIADESNQLATLEQRREPPSPGLGLARRSALDDELSSRHRHYLTIASNAPGNSVATSPAR